jgi:hypothetical protein
MKIREEKEKCMYCFSHFVYSHSLFTQHDRHRLGGYIGNEAFLTGNHTRKR